MHITMMGDGRLLGPLAILATRAGHTVLRVDETATDVASCSLSEMMIAAGDRARTTRRPLLFGGMVRSPGSATLEIQKRLVA